MIYCISYRKADIPYINTEKRISTGVILVLQVRMKSFSAELLLLLLVLMTINGISNGMSRSPPDWHEHANAEAAFTDHLELPNAEAAFTDHLEQNNQASAITDQHANEATDYHDDIATTLLPDTTHLTDEELICILRASKKNCIKDKANEENGHQCQCMPVWQCGATIRSILPSHGMESSPSRVHHEEACPDPQMVCCETPSLIPQVHEEDDHATSECGQMKPVRTLGLSVQANQAQLGQYPWMALVFEKLPIFDSVAKYYVSGASLIHKGVVLTAAHKVHDKDAHDLVVRVGEWNMKVKTEPIPHQDIQVEKIAIHPNFQHKHLTSDLALLFLKKSATIGSTVGTICLPDHSDVFDNATCFMSGHGKIDDEGGNYQEILKSIRLKAVNHHHCEDLLRASHLGPTFHLDESFMCAQRLQTIDSCTGDGGSPLVCSLPSDSTHFIQVGVVSWGIECGHDGMPGVYASVSEGISWIRGEITKHFGISELAYK